MNGHFAFCWVVCSIHVNVRPETMKTLEESIGSNLFDISHINFFLDISPEAKKTKAKIHYWDFIKIKSCGMAKETVNKTKRQSTEWEKIFANDIANKGLVSKICKKLMKLNTPKQNNPIK